jgi:hypothetical protein
MLDADAMKAQNPRPRDSKKEWRHPVIDTRPLRFTNSIARRAWLRLVSAQPNAFIAPRFLTHVEKERDRKVVLTKKS